MRFLLLLILTFSSAAQASRDYWLHGTGPGSRYFWEYGGSDCRRDVGSRAFWNSCVGKSGTKDHWEYGSGHGSRQYWNYQTAGARCEKAGNANFYQYCQAPGSLYYWQYGQGLGSREFWNRTSVRSISPDWIGPCLEGNLDTAFCEALRNAI